MLLAENTSILQISGLMDCVTYVWVGVDSDWEQEKLEPRKMLVNADRMSGRSIEYHYPRKAKEEIRYPNQVWATDVTYIGVLEEHYLEISIDGKGRALDTIYVERLWRTLKYEDIYLNSYESLRELNDGVDCYFRFYNIERFHQGLDYRTPEEAYQSFVSDASLPLAG